MGVKINIPEIAALRCKVEKQFGCPLRTPKDFMSVSYDIMDKMSENLSEATLQRVWQYKAGYETVAIHTLDILCRYCKYPNWDAFCLKLHEESPEYSSMEYNDILGPMDITRLEKDTLIRIGWLPNRLCVIKYLGDFRFEAIETHNSKLSVGDTFDCMRLQIGREMYCDNLQRGNTFINYVAGCYKGLTTLEIIVSDKENNH